MKEIEVFPNTGHQYFIIPLKELFSNKGEEELRRIVKKNRGSWEPWDQFTPWIRYQYAFEYCRYSKEDIPVVKLAVETNLGLASRGILFNRKKYKFGETKNRQEKEAYERFQEYENERQTDSLIYPYASDDIASIWEDYPDDHRMPLEWLPAKRGGPYQLDDGKDEDGNIKYKLYIHWKEPAGADPIDVDLIVDLGNTRTDALLLESPGQDYMPFGRRVKILRFVPHGEPYRLPQVDPDTGAIIDDCAIINSWLLLHRPVFSATEPPISDDKIYSHWNSYLDDGETLYENLDYLPQTFVELSPALVGGGSSPAGTANVLARISLNEDARFLLSSPKRYVWDEEPLGHRGSTYWKQILNDTDSKLPGEFGKLNGLFRYFMDPGGVDWEISQSSPRDNFKSRPFVTSDPTYPRRDAVCWFALSIIESAYRQMNSSVYLRQTGREALPRRLRNIRVTYPSGWTFEERSKYFTQWQRAIDLFGKNHLSDDRPISIVSPNEGGEKPILAEKQIDEAVCSQLPVLYSDIKALGGNSNNWFDLYGDSGEDEKSVVVMNVDIGGGTTDIAIIKYEPSSLNSDSVLKDKRKGKNIIASLQSTLLLRNGYNIAGDMLVKKIIEKILLPSWLNASGVDQFNDNPAAKAALITLFKNPASDFISLIEPRAQTKLIRIIRLVFIPLVNQWLQQLILREGNPGLQWQPLIAKKYANESALKDLNMLAVKIILAKTKCWADLNELPFDLESNDFNEWFESINESGQVPFPVDQNLIANQKTIEDCIDEVFETMFSSLGVMSAKFGCQLVIVSGKPSELPRLRTLLLQSIPLLPQRIIQIKNFPAGDWYPSVFITEDGGKINDAKTSTVAGAALYQDICNGNLEGFSIHEKSWDETSNTFSQQYTWGILTAGALPEDFYGSENVLFNEHDYRGAKVNPDNPKQKYVEKEFDLPLNCRIGRQLSAMKGISADPVYKVAWIPPSQQDNTPVYARLKIRWIMTTDEGEKLELIDVSPLHNSPLVDFDSVKLKLNTMIEESFWLDDPKLEVEHLFKSTSSYE